MGTQQQRPPAFSAKHVDGERSHRLARRGVEVELPPVEVTVYAIELLAWHAPDAEFRVTVSAGTYVRALARDVGTKLGLGAHLVALRRESIGALSVNDALPLDAIEAPRRCCRRSRCWATCRGSSSTRRRGPWLLTDAPSRAPWASRARWRWCRAGNWSRWLRRWRTGYNRWSCSRPHDPRPTTHHG